MLSILISWVVLGAAFLLTAELLPGFQLTGGWRGAAVVSAIFGIINWLIGWLLFVVLWAVRQTVEPSDGPWRPWRKRVPSRPNGPHGHRSPGGAASRNGRASRAARDYTRR